MARHPAMTNKAILGARKFMEFLSNFAKLRLGRKLQISVRRICTGICTNYELPRKDVKPMPCSG
jgi:hypothetical protein